MRKVYMTNGKFLCEAKDIKETTTGVELTCHEDFPGMLEKTIIYIDSKIVYEDENRIYIE